MFTNIFRKICSSVVATAIVCSVVVLQSCSKEKDKEVPEPPKQGVELRFAYDSAELSNPLISPTNCLSLFVYDESGNYVKSVTETSSALTGENYVMQVELPEGKYQLIAWGGIACADASFNLVSTPAAGSKVGELQVVMKDNCKNANPGVNLHPLYYGTLGVSVPAGSDKLTQATVPMICDTNNIRIILQNTNNTPVNVADFTFEIVDDNSLLNYQNEVISQNPLTYYPCATGQTEAGTNVTVGYADFSTSRLIAVSNCMLTVIKKDGNRTVLSIPLINYILLGQGENSEMTDQQFLDHHTQWTLTLYLEEGFWVSSRFKLNDWELRLNDTKL